MRRRESAPDGSPGVLPDQTVLDRVRRGLRGMRLRRDRRAARTAASLAESLESAMPRPGGAPSRGVLDATSQRVAGRLVEAAFGLRLLRRGFDVEREVRVPRGRTCDFVARREGVTFAFHLKQVEPVVGRPSEAAGSSRVERSLERVPRGWIVGWRRRADLDPEAVASLVAVAREFILGAGVGEEFRSLDARGRELAAARILAPSASPTVRLIRLGSLDLEERVDRLRRLLNKAALQFLPGATNVVVFGIPSPKITPDLEVALEASLFGTIVERWDRFPPRGARVAHGRAGDGFWEGGRVPDSRLAGWFSAVASTRALPGGWWSRTEEVPSRVRTMLEELLGRRTMPTEPA